MPDPILVPSIAMLTGGSMVARDYLLRRFDGAEDRYMALYGRQTWDASNMDLDIRFDPADDARVKAVFVARLLKHVATEEGELLRERLDPDGGGLDFLPLGTISPAQLCTPRRGVWFDLSVKGLIRCVWNHMQTDGVGMWGALRGLFDPNPPIVPFRGVKPPPPFLPEIYSLPSLARRARWKGALREAADAATGPLTRKVTTWKGAEVRAIKDRYHANFNLVTSALVVQGIFERHPEAKHLIVGLTAYFPFLNSRNRYGVLLCKVRRGSLSRIVAAFQQQTKSAMKGWGVSSATSYALGRTPEAAFEQIMGTLRRRIDVLISSLPVGQLPITLGGHAAQVTCYPWELTLPYYFLIVGTRDELTLSHTSRFALPDDFLAVPEYGRAEADTPAWAQQVTPCRRAEAAAPGSS